MRNRMLIALICAASWVGLAAAQSKAGSLTTQDYIDIQQLYARYNEAIDSGNAEAYADTFTPDGTFNTYKGRQGLIEFIGQWTGRMNGGNRRHWNTTWSSRLLPTARTGPCTSCCSMSACGRRGSPRRRSTPTRSSRRRRAGASRRARQRGTPRHRPRSDAGAATRSPRCRPVRRQTT